MWTNLRIGFWAALTSEASLTSSSRRHGHPMLTFRDFCETQLDYPNLKIGCVLFYISIRNLSIFGTILTKEVLGIIRASLSDGRLGKMTS